MLRNFRVLVPTLLSVALVLAGCGRSQAPDSSAASASSRSVAASARVTQASSASAGAASAAVPGDHAQTRHYRIDIEYPRLPASDAVLSKALHQAGNAAKREFMQGISDLPDVPGMADRQMQLKVNFSIAARMPRFVSVREKGMADTGGAHPIPIDASFVYATKAAKVLSLDDLFVQPDQARETLATFARSALEKKLLVKVPGGSKTSPKVRKEWVDNMRKMIQEGTAPTARNFSEFVVLAGAGDRASGLQLIFSPYQVAPYVYGAQTVDVPVDVIADLLKPDYRDAFDTPHPASP